MKVSIIIPNYNGVKYLANCLDSLSKQSIKDFEIILVDNNSTDNSIELIQNNYNYVKIIKLEQNYGFSRAVNEGIKLSDSDYVLLLNNDTTASEDFVMNMVKFIDKKRSAFSVSSKMIQMYNKELLDSAGDLYTVLGWAVNRGVGRSVDEFNRSTKIFSSCAGAAIYKREIFDEIGYFDENHFAYLEDIDICYRAKINGYTNWYNPAAVVYHAGSATSGSKYNSFKVKLSSRNSIYLNYKNMPNWQLVLNFIPLLLGYIVKYFFFVKKGFARDYIIGIKEGLASRNKLTRQTKAPIITYLKIELELIANTFRYVKDWLKRKLS